MGYPFPQLRGLLVYAARATSGKIPHRCYVMLRQLLLANSQFQVAALALPSPIAAEDGLFWRCVIINGCSKRKKKSKPQKKKDSDHEYNENLTRYLIRLMPAGLPLEGRRHIQHCSLGIVGMVSCWDRHI